MNSTKNKKDRSMAVQVRDVIVGQLSGSGTPLNKQVLDARELAEEFCVGLETVKQALELLAVHQPKNGIGLELLASALDPKFSVPQVRDYEGLRDLAGNPISLDVQLLRVEEVRPTDLDKVRFQLTSNDRLIKRQNLCTHRGHPVLLEDVYEQLVELDAEPMSKGKSALYEAGTRFRGVKTLASKEVISLAKANSETAVLLEVPMGSPLLRIERVDYDDHGVAIGWRWAECRPDYVKYSFAIK